MLGQLLDRNAAIEQDAFVAVDVGDLGFAASGRGEARIVGEHPGLGVELADVDHVRADRARVDRERPILVADRKLGGLDVGAGLRVHDAYPRCGRPSRPPRSTCDRACRAAREAHLVWVSHSVVRCKVDRSGGSRTAQPGAAWSRSRARLSCRPEHRQDVENAGRGGPPGQRRAQRLRHRAELEAPSARQRRAPPARWPRRSRVRPPPERR